MTDTLIQKLEALGPSFMVVGEPLVKLSDVLDIVRSHTSENSVNEELLALQWADWNQKIFLDRQYYRSRTYMRIADEIISEANFYGDEGMRARAEGARKLFSLVEKDAIAYADKKYKDEKRVKPTEAPKRESSEAENLATVPVVLPWVNKLANVRYKGSAQIIDVELIE